MEERKKFKLKITDFIGDRLVTREAILESLEDALKQCKREFGHIKIYDFLGCLVHSEHRRHEPEEHHEPDHGHHHEPEHGHHHEPEHGHHHGHDHGHHHDDDHCEHYA